jgi:hypothetical protein
MKKFPKAIGAVFMVGATGFIMMSGCAVYQHGPRAGMHDNSYAFADSDDYIYYPRYDVYYSSRRHQYAYRQGNVWVSRPSPPNVSVAVICVSPSVKMDFHDSPAAHHDAVARKYPHNWSPAAHGADRKEEPKAENHDKKDKHGKTGTDRNKPDDKPSTSAPDKQR